MMGREKKRKKWGEGLLAHTLKKKTLRCEGRERDRPPPPPPAWHRPHSASGLAPFRGVGSEGRDRRQLQPHLRGGGRGIIRPSQGRHPSAAPTPPLPACPHSLAHIKGRVAY